MKETFVVVAGLIATILLATDAHGDIELNVDGNGPIRRVSAVNVKIDVRLELDVVIFSRNGVYLGKILRVF